MKRLLCIILVILTLASIALPIFAEEEEAVAVDLDKTSVTEDLSKIFSLSQFAYNSIDNGVYLINVTEVGATKDGMVDHALYLYFYNPSAKSFTDSQFNQVSVGNKFDTNGEPTEYVKMPMSFISSSPDLVLLKYKLDAPPGAIWKDKTKRRYAISGVEFQDSESYDVHEYSCARMYEFEGFDGSITVKTTDLMTVQLECHQVSYLSGDSGKDEPQTGAYSNQINSVYFSVPDSLMKKYGELYAVEYEYYHYRTNPIIVANTTDYQLRSVLGEMVGKKDFNFKLYGDYTCITNPNLGGATVHTYDYYIGKKSEGSDNILNPIIYNYNTYFEYYTSLFHAKDITDRESILVSADELQRYFKAYNKSSYTGSTVGSYGYNADLFDLASSYGYKKVEVSIEDDFSLPSYADSKNNSFIKNFISGKWDYAFNIDKYDNSIDDVKYIEKINPIDFEDANSDTFRVDESYLADMEKFQSAEALKGNTTYLLRYAYADDYYCTEMTTSGTGVDGKVLAVQENVYLDFDILTLSFRSEPKDGKSVPIITKIPVVSDPTDGFTDVKNETPDHDIINAPDWSRVKVVLGVMLGILAVVALFDVVIPIFSKGRRNDKW